MNDWSTRAAKKIETLRHADSKLWIFGASDHLYRLAPTLSEVELLELERCYAVRLPDDYRTYLMQIGNGGCGPGYGLQRFGDGRHLASRPIAKATGKLRQVANTPQCAISVSIMVDENGREVDLFDLRFYHTIERLLAEPAALARPFPFVVSGFRLDEEPDESDESAVAYEGAFEGGAGDGILQLAYYGCGIFAFLVVTGEAFGTVWVNDRTNGKGLGHVADYLPADYLPEDMLHGGFWRKPGPHSFADWYEDWLDTSLDLASRA